MRFTRRDDEKMRMRRNGVLPLDHFETSQEHTGIVRLAVRICVSAPFRIRLDKRSHIMDTFQFKKSTNIFRIVPNWEELRVMNLVESTWTNDKKPYSIGFERDLDYRNQDRYVLGKKLVQLILKRPTRSFLRRIFVEFGNGRGDARDFGYFRDVGFSKGYIGGSSSWHFVT
ncbi:hypothetical protein Tco_0345015 [Tanacetum coccineum]